MSSPRKLPLMRASRALVGVGIPAAALQSHLLAGAALAGALHLPPDAQALFKRTAGCCPSHAECNFGEQDGGFACSGPKGIFRPDCVDVPEIADLVTLPLGEPVAVSATEGVAEDDWRPLTWVHAVTPAAEPHLLATRLTGLREPNALTLSFESSRRTVTELVDPADPVLEAWPVGTEAGIAVIGQSDALRSEVTIVLETPALVRIATSIACTDVRTFNAMMRCAIDWSLASTLDPRLAACGSSIEVPDQGMSLLAYRSTPVSPADADTVVLALQEGTYTLSVDFYRPSTATHAALNGCGIMFGAWSVHDEATLEIGLVLPGDLDGSGIVDYGDVALALLDYGACAGACPADLDESGEVDSGDVALVLLEYGNIAPPPTNCS